MPKETKKFINPLLRPSQQEVEPKQETPPKQEKNAPGARIQTSRSQPAEPEEKVISTPPASLNQVITAPEVVPTNGDSVRARSTREKIKAAPSPPDAERTGRDARQDEAAHLERRDEHVQKYEPQVETLRADANQTVLRPETPLYTARVSTSREDVVIEPEGGIEDQPDFEGEMGEDRNEDPEIDFSSNPSKHRRNKGPQAFEKTHVRFTVWVDKSLKQSFEDIASQRDKPKTTLINEALADLVRKYETP